MGRTHVATITQPTDSTCGPASIKHALAVFGKRKSMAYLTQLCKTTRNGTSTKNMIQALNNLGFSVLSVTNATLSHVLVSLKHNPQKPRAVIVDYLYELETTPEEHWSDSGHWATVSSFSGRDGKITLFDSFTGTKKSYNWRNFRERWVDYDIVKKRKSTRSKKFRMYKRWQKQLLLVVSPKEEFLPKFRYATAKVYPGSVN